MRDLYHNIDTKRAFAQADVTATSTAGEIIDAIGFESVTFVAAFGTIVGVTASKYVELKLQHGEDPTGSDFVDVPEDDYLGGIPKVTSTTQKVAKIGYRGVKRYLKLVPTVTGTGVTCPMSATVILGHPNAVPVE